MDLLDHSSYPPAYCTISPECVWKVSSVVGSVRLVARLVPGRVAAGSWTMIFRNTHLKLLSEPLRISATSTLPVVLLILFCMLELLICQYMKIGVLTARRRPIDEHLVIYHGKLRSKVEMWEWAVMRFHPGWSSRSMNHRGEP